MENDEVVEKGPESVGLMENYVAAESASSKAVEKE